MLPSVENATGTKAGVHLMMALGAGGVNFHAPAMESRHIVRITALVHHLCIRPDSGKWIYWANPILFCTCASFAIIVAGLVLRPKNFVAEACDSV
jgi:hypothetical protein